MPHMGDLLVHSKVRWLSAGKCLEQFLALRNEIPIFLSDVKSDISNLEENLCNSDFPKELAFLTDISGHLNDLNTKLQGKDQTVPILFGNVNGFCNS
jgi:hypothetical protein